MRRVGSATWSRCRSHRRWRRRGESPRRCPAPGARPMVITMWRTRAGRANISGWSPMVDLVPVDHDPFEDAPAYLVPLDHDPFATPKPGQIVPPQNVLSNINAATAAAGRLIAPNLSAYVNAPPAPTGL